MSFLPIVERELRVASRRSRTFWSRVGAALASAVFGGWLLVASAFGGRSSGAAAFDTLVLFTFLFCLTAGLQLTADSISSEKREGTLGFLLLTPLKRYDIVLGKLAAGTITAFYSLLATFPVFSMALVFGGVSAATFVRVAFLLLNSLFLSAAVGICFSTFGREARQGQRNGTLLLLSLWIVIPLASSALASLRYPRLAFLLGFVGMASRPLAPQTAGSLASPSGFWLHQSVIHLEAWAFLAIAIFGLARVWPERISSGSKPTWQARWNRFRFGKPLQREKRRKALLRLNPVLWLVSRSRLKSAGLWVGITLATLILASVFYYPLRKWPFVWGSLLAAATTSLYLKTWIAGEASHHLAQEKASGALEFLLSTPLAVEEIIRGQWMAIWRVVLAPVIWLLGLLGIAVSSLLLAPDLPGGSPRNYLLVIGASVIMFGADLIALKWTAMWKGIRARNARQARTETIVQLLFLPNLFFYAAISVTFVLLGSRAPSFDQVFPFAVVGWLLTGLAVDAVFGWWACRNLKRRLREFASPSYDPSGSWGRWLGLKFARWRVRAKRN